MNSEGLKKQARIRALNKVQTEIRKLTRIESHMRCNMYCRQDIEALEDIIEASREMIEEIKDMRS